jgi:hypothetical protein
MGADIHTFVETFRDGRWQYETGALVTPMDEWADPSEPFEWRHYSMFGFLAGVRDHDVPQIAETRGLPDDVSAEVRGKHGNDPDWFSESWLTLAELLAYDGYDRPTNYRYGTNEPLREVLGDMFFQHLDDLGKLAARPEDVRVVFWFDN